MPSCCGAVVMSLLKRTNSLLQSAVEAQWDDTELDDKLDPAEHEPVKVPARLQRPKVSWAVRFGQDSNSSGSNIDVDFCHHRCLCRR